MQTLQYFQKRFFAHKKLKKSPSKVAHNRPKATAQPNPHTANSPKLIFHIIEMCHQASVLFPLGTIPMDHKCFVLIYYKPVQFLSTKIYCQNFAKVAFSCIFCSPTLAWELVCQFISPKSELTILA